MPNMSVSFLNKRKVKQICRVCREVAELKGEGLCADCVRVKAKIRLRTPLQLPLYTPSADGDPYRTQSAVFTFRLPMRRMRGQNA